MWQEFWISLTAIALWWLLRRSTRYQRMIDKFPGPTAYPIVGSVLAMGRNSIELHEKVHVLSKTYQWQPYRLWLGPFHSIIILDDPKNIEIVLGSKTMVEKGFLYVLFEPWLGCSLFRCNAETWRNRRRLLTPTFHIKILENFVETFSSNAQILVRKLQKEVDGGVFDIIPYLSLCALDIVVETAMGCQINAQNGCATEFLHAIQDQVHIFMKRSLEPWLFPDFLFNLSPTKKLHDTSLKILNDTTNSVIKARREEMLMAKQEGTSSIKTEDGLRKRLAFLDLMLIEASSPGSQVTDKIIREEGFETSFKSMSFTIWLLSWHQDIQEKLSEEIEEAFLRGDGVLTPKSLHDMKYMDRVIYESLRIYPTAPFLSREIAEDVKLADGKIAPKGSNLVVSILAAHKNPEIYPDPERFDPDRFLPEHCLNRSPYAFIPFSAGPRNCLGQKQAMMEMKTILGHLLHNYRILPDPATPRLTVAAEMTISPKPGIPIRIVARGSAQRAAI